MNDIYNPNLIKLRAETISGVKRGLFTSKSNSSTGTFPTYLLVKFYPNTRRALFEFQL
jgi:hypothetical protein